MKRIFVYKLITIILILIAIAAVATRAQESTGANPDEDVTNFDEFFVEESSNPSSDTDKNANDSQIGVTVLDA